MKRFDTGILLAGFLASGIAVVPMACGPVENDADLDADIAAPQMGSQEQETYWGNLGEAMGRPLVSDTTVGKTNDVSSNCAGTNTAPDLSFTWTPPYAGTFVFTTEGSMMDTVLTIHPVTDSTNVRCNDDEPNGNQWSSLQLSDLSTTQGYTIVVDGYGKGAGAIKLNIYSPGGICPNGCGTPPANGCYDTPQCQDGVCVPKPKPLGASCSTGQCVANQICDGAGTCGGGTVQCVINGACYANGVANPANACQVCNTALSTTAWSNQGAGVACNDGNACTVNDVCNGAGACGGAPMQCTNTQGQCYEAACENGTCVTRAAAEGTSCSDGYSCTTGDACNGFGKCVRTTCVGTECRPFKGCTSTGACQYGSCPAGTTCVQGSYCGGTFP